MKITFPKDVDRRKRHLITWWDSEVETEIRFSTGNLLSNYQQHGPSTKGQQFWI